jgi:hypothetical protein
MTFKSSALEVCEDAKALRAYRITMRPLMPIVPASLNRDWMDRTSGRFAYRCLPLLIANQSGWMILNSSKVATHWDGSNSADGLQVSTADGSASSHFGYGILTWTLPYLFRTPKGYNLQVRGPANYPKDGVCALEGIVESDWTEASFTMNWQITRPNTTITFERDEPICMIVPQKRGELELFSPEVCSLRSDDELNRRHTAWGKSRKRFLEAAASVEHTEGWQKHYFRGTTISGDPAEQHQTRLKIRAFTVSY